MSYEITTKGLVPANQDVPLQISKVLDEFHSIVFKIIRQAQGMYPNNPDIEWLQKKLGLARSIDPCLIMNRCKDKIWSYKDQILTNDEDFFINERFGRYIKDDENKTFINTLMHTLKAGYSRLSDAEKTLVWGQMSGLLKCVVEYMKLTADHK